MAVDKTLVRRGANLDVFLRFQFNGGVQGEVTIQDKAGNILEHFQYSLNETTVQKWLATVAARSIRRAIGWR